MTAVRFAGERRCAPDAARAACFALALAAVAGQAHAVGSDELLEPENAFRISAEALGERSVEVRFEIAEGYYMYRDRFKFETAAGRRLADVELPPGERKRDPFSGETATYRGQVAMRVPLSEADAVHGRAKLKVTSQGCLDQRVCYAPLEQVVEVRLAGPGATGATAPAVTDGRRRAKESVPAPASTLWAQVALLFAAGVAAAVALSVAVKAWARIFRARKLVFWRLAAYAAAGALVVTTLAVALWRAILLANEWIVRVVPWGGPK